ncbi:MAG: ABC transporter substrate-binding protein [Acidimicrobiales bacterium]|nr:ABC transporter substrate-binding protein [Acidimicrobiales bacterium]
MRRRLVALTGLVALAAAACGGDEPGSAGPITTADRAKAKASAPTEPSGPVIKLGAVTSLTGVNVFPEPTDAASAVFEVINAQGGINGHRIELLVEDDGNTLDGAREAARRLVEDEQVLAVVGGGSVVDCLANADYYAAQNILNLAGVAACGPNAGNVASMNTGPHLGAMMTMSYLVEQRGVKNLCYSALNIDIATVFRDVYLPLWESVTGHKVHSLIFSEPGADLTPAVIQARNDGCDGVMLVYTKPDYISYAEIAQAQGMLGGPITYAMLTSGYDDKVLYDLGALGEGWVTNSEFLPYTEDEVTTTDMADFKQLLKGAGIQETSFAQGGYLAAKATVDALRTIQGEYTREAISDALKGMNYQTDLLGAPARWVPYQGPNQLNTSSKIVEIRNGAFVTLTDWVFWPPRA